MFASHTDSRGRDFAGFVEGPTKRELSILEGNGNKLRQRIFYGPLLVWASRNFGGCLVGSLPAHGLNKVNLL